jgi:glycine cleavage system protein P-like pyridoxal-binding family
MGSLGCIFGRWRICFRMEKDGLRQVSRDAVLSANYILANLKEDFHAPFADQALYA